MTQLDLFYPAKVSIDGVVSPDGHVQYLGNAYFNGGDGRYRCLAIVFGCLVIVEAKITFDPAAAAG